jgi:hypothetical protein
MAACGFAGGVYDGAEPGDVIMKSNHLYLIIGALVAAVIALGIYVWREQSKPAGVEIKIDGNGLSIQEN